MNMTIYAVIGYPATKLCLYVPQIYYLSLNKDKCYEYIKEKEKNEYFKNRLQIEKLKTETSLEYLIQPIIE